MAKELNKKGQVALWFIIATIIVVVVVSLLYLRSSIVKVNEEDQNFLFDLRSCVRESIENVSKTINLQGGFMHPSNYHEYNLAKVEYLCYNKNNYLPCVMQHPFLVKDIKRELENNTYDKIEECFTNLKNTLESQSNTVEYGATSLDFTLAPSSIFVRIDKDVKIKKNEQESSYDGFNFDIKSDSYDLATLASEIASQEAKYCYFENLGYEILHPDYHVVKNKLDDGAIIYTINDKKTGESLSFAIRGCVTRIGNE